MSQRPENGTKNRNFQNYYGQSVHSDWQINFDISKRYIDGSLEGQVVHVLGQSGSFKKERGMLVKAHP